MKKKRVFLKQVRLLLVVTFSIAVLPMLNAAESVSNKLQRCGLISVASERLECYDQLDERQNSASVKAIEPSTLPSDDLGAESLKGRHSKSRESEPVNVRVTKCSKKGRKNSNNIKYIFHLEGGQVWKQISDKRLYFKDCNFDASIQKDFFGYKMQLEDTNKKFRISRIR